MGVSGRLHILCHVRPKIAPLEQPPTAVHSHPHIFVRLHRPGRLVKIEKPNDADAAVHREWLLVELRRPWTVGGTTHPAGALLALLPGPLLDLADGDHGVAPRLLGDLRDDGFLRLLGRHLGDLLEARAVLFVGVGEFLADEPELLVAIVQFLPASLDVGELPLERLLACGEALLRAGHLLPSGAQVILGLAAERPDLVRRLDEGFAGDPLRFPLGFEDEALRRARLALCAAVRQVLANGLSLLGVNALEKM